MSYLTKKIAYRRQFRDLRRETELKDMLRLWGHDVEGCDTVPVMVQKALNQAYQRGMSLRKVHGIQDDEA
jgi:hypothetical protein